MTSRLDATVLTPLPVIGLIGGIASGKSTLARWVAEHHPVLVIDADGLGHAALRDPTVQSRLRDAFGADVFHASGEVNRRALADRVFGGTSTQEASRRMLETIVHPWIEQEMWRQIDEAAPNIQAVLLDAAVLLEAGWDRHCAAVAFVETPDARRIDWARTQRGWSPDELVRRAASQWSLERKRAAADWVVANDSSIEQGGRQLWGVVQEVIKKRKSPAG